jgi:hypothetical protein
MHRSLLILIALRPEWPSARTLVQVSLRLQGKLPNLSDSGRQVLVQTRRALPV